MTTFTTHHISQQQWEQLSLVVTHMKLAEIHWGWNVSPKSSPSVYPQSPFLTLLSLSGSAAVGIVSPQWPSYTFPISYFSAWASLWCRLPYYWLEWSRTSTSPSQHPGSNPLSTFPGVLWICVPLPGELHYTCVPAAQERPGWLHTETGPNVIPQLLVPTNCPISLSALHIQGATGCWFIWRWSMSSWVSCCQHRSTAGYTNRFLRSQHFKLPLEEKAEQMVPGLGATHLWRLQNAQPGQRPLAMLNNLSTYVSVLSCYYSGSSCTSRIRRVLPPALTLWSWICVILKTDYVTSQWTTLLGWAWLPYLAWLPK